MTDEPDWAKVLHALHEAQASVPKERGRDFTTYDLIQLTEKTNLDPEEIEDAAQYLHDAELLTTFDFKLEDEELESGFLQGGLTPEGFKIAHEREISKRQEKTNAALVVFTLALVFVGIAGNLPKPGARIVADLVILLGVLAVVRWTNLLNLPGL